MTDPCPVQCHWVYNKQELIDFSQQDNPVNIIQWLYDRTSKQPIGLGQRELNDALRRILELTKNRPRYDAHIHI